jgi:hypothetical protein
MIHTHGARRRICAWCKRTWTKRPKKRGRPKRRAKRDGALRYIHHERTPLSREKNERATATRSKHLRADRDALIREIAWTTAPEGALIAVADAIVMYLGKRWYTWYFILIRPIAGEDAHICPPYLEEGKETPLGWSNAFALLPHSEVERIVALVSDGHTGLIHEAEWRGWLVQRCHSHLLQRIQGRLSRRPTGRNIGKARKLFALVERVLLPLDNEALQKTLQAIDQFADHDTHSRDLRRILKGLVNNYDHYRTYLAYPEYNLPVTNNSAESLNSLIRELWVRARGFRTASAFNLWIHAICKTRATIKCRRKSTE